MISLLQKYTTLQGIKQTPNGAKMLCPYHADSSPSFHIHEEKGFAKCFSCHEFRPLFTFLLEMGVPLADAIEYQFNFVPNHEPGQNDELKDAVLGYHLPKSMLNRGYTPETLDHFRVGYDPLAGHTTVPMLYQGKVFGIKYRVFPKEFWYSDNFRKEQFIYNYAPTKDRYYVEGESDTWRVWQNGTTEVSALLGCDMTAAQAELVMQHERVYLALDPDRAGFHGMYKAYELLRETNVELYVVMYKAEDAGACTEEEWVRAIQFPKPIMEFLINFQKRCPDLHKQWATWERGYTLSKLK